MINVFFGGVKDALMEIVMMEKGHRKTHMIKDSQNELLGLHGVTGINLMNKNIGAEVGCSIQ